MLNYIMTLSAGTEALDPFVIQISDDASGISIKREDNLDPKNPDANLYDVTLSQMERRGGVLGEPLDLGTFQEVTQCETPKDFRVKRLAALKQDLDSETDPVKRACLETRIGQIEWPTPDAIEWGDRRTRALQFVERRDFAINGAAGRSSSGMACGTATRFVAICAARCKYLSNSAERRNQQNVEQRNHDVGAKGQRIEKAARHAS